VGGETVRIPLFVSAGPFGGGNSVLIKKEPLKRNRKQPQELPWEGGSGGKKKANTTEENGGTDVYLKKGKLTN